MLDKLDAIKAKFDNLGVALTNPEIVSNNKKFSSMSKEYRSLGKIVDVRNAYVKLLEDIEFNKEVLYSDDEEMRDMAKNELPGLEEKKKRSKNKYAIYLFRKTLTTKRMLFLKSEQVRVEMKHRCLQVTY